MELKDINIGFAMTGSFCTFSKVVPQMKHLIDCGANVYPIMSEFAFSTDTRFGKAEQFIDEIQQMTGREIIHSIQGAEPIGPKKFLDALIVAPATGNTIAKLANGITDSPVTMAAKANLRNEKPLIIAISTNDALGGSAKNIGMLMNMKNIYFVPFSQDDPVNKPKSIVADMSKIEQTVIHALCGMQIQPLFC